MELQSAFTISRLQISKLTRLNQLPIMCGIYETSDSSSMHFELYVYPLCWTLQVSLWNIWNIIQVEHTELKVEQKKEYFWVIESLFWKYWRYFALKLLLP